MTKDRLRGYRDKLAERDQLRRLLETLDTSKGDPRRQRLDGMPTRGKGGKRDTLQKGYESREQVREIWQAKDAELSQELLEIEQALDSLPSRERRVLRCYYVQGMTWEQVCVETCYSWRQVHRIHTGALKMLEEVKV